MASQPFEPNRRAAAAARRFFWCQPAAPVQHGGAVWWHHRRCAVAGQAAESITLAQVHQQPGADVQARHDGVQAMYLIARPLTVMLMLLTPAAASSTPGSGASGFVGHLADAGCVHGAGFDGHHLAQGFNHRGLRGAGGGQQFVIRRGMCGQGGQQQGGFGQSPQPQQRISAAVCPARCRPAPPPAPRRATASAAHPAAAPQTRHQKWAPSRHTRQCVPRPG